MPDDPLNNAIQNVEQAAIGAATLGAETLATKALGPAGGQLVDTVLPVVLGPLVNALHGLFAHIGAPVPDELKAAKDTLDKWTGGVL